MQPSRIIGIALATLVGVGGIAALVLRPTEPSTTPSDAASTTPSDGGALHGTDGVAVAPAPEGARPNVLIVLWDTVRADRMSLYGHPVQTTPRLEAFARDATVFDHATAPAMWTLPTHAAIFTGRYPSTHGARGGYRWLDEHHETLAELLAGVGYDTFWFTSNIVASPMTNLTQGFETIHSTYPRAGAKRGRYVAAARRATQAKLIPRDASTEISPAFTGNAIEKWGKSVQKDAAPVITNGLLEWLDERTEPEAPFFAYLNFMEAHTPRIPSMAARQRVMTPEQLELGLSTDLSLFAENEFMIGERSYTPEQLEAIRGVYDAALVDLDDATGDLLDALATRGILDQTLVIVVADHGEHLGEHQRLEHRWSVHQPLLHVPLVIRYPGVFGPSRVQQRVSTADVFSTVLDIAGIEAPEGTQTTSLRGRRAYDPYVFSQLLDPWASTLKHVEEVYPDHDYTPLVRTYCAAFEGMDKLIYASNGAHELYDLATDPLESRDLAQDRPERVRSLSQALYTWEQALPLYDPTQRGEADLKRATRQDDAEAAMLVALGYAAEDGEDLSRARCGPDTAPSGEQP
ncbi:MAG TPA: DUF229 domain-containing protein [Deltaproteobacteria bacterium]|nr:DUF229 domain-containing protein [Deltaproteobacteria bacterium]